jgi:PIN domain nuclease of toxin-antitoxin system
MKILLDTQVFIWLVNSDPRLGAQGKKLAHSTAHELYISYLSFFEMTIKASLGKLQFDPALINDVSKMGVELLAGDQKSLEHYRVFDESNKDPFDNFLIATAKANELTLMTSDKRILEVAVDGLHLIDATV